MQENERIAKAAAVAANRSNKDRASSSQKYDSVSDKTAVKKQEKMLLIIGLVMTIIRIDVYRLMLQLNMPKQEDNLSESKQSKFESHPFPKCINQK